MKYLINLILVILFCAMLAGCAHGDRDGRAESHRYWPAWMFEGWACAPDAAKAATGMGPHMYCQDDGDRSYLYGAIVVEDSFNSNYTEDSPENQLRCAASGRQLLQQRGYVRGVLYEIVAGYLLHYDGPALTAREIRQYEARFHGASVYRCCLFGDRTGYCNERPLPGKARSFGCICSYSAKYPGGQRAFEEVPDE